MGMCIKKSIKTKKQKKIVFKEVLYCLFYQPSTYIIQDLRQIGWYKPQK